MISSARTAALVLLTSTLGFTMGCGEGSTPVEPPQISLEERIERDLQGVIDNGQVGSEVMLLEESLQKLAETDPAKAQELTADLEELKGLRGPRAKAKAEKMVEKL